MAKYEVIRAWYGVKVGDVVDIETPHDSLKSNVRPLQGQAGELTPSTQQSSVDRKGMIAKKLKELGVTFDGRKSADELALLLPDGELGKLFPSE